MTFDFRASQLRTSKLIASGSTGTSAKLLLYPIDADSISSPNIGNINSSVFNTSSIGSDVFLFISGSKSSKNQVNSHGAAVFGGDAVVSGNFYVHSDVQISGSLSLTGGLTASISVTKDGLPYVTGSGITAYYNAQGQWELTSSGGGLPTATSGNQLLSSLGPGDSYAAIDTVLAIANIPPMLGEVNSFHLYEVSGNFQDRGSSPQTMTVVGDLRYAKPGPKTLVPSVWAASSNPSKLSFPISPGYNAPFTMACNFISNNETFSNGKLLFSWAGSFGGVWISATSTTVQLCIQNGGAWDTVVGQEIPIDWSKPHRLLVTWVYSTGYLAIDGVIVDAVSRYPAVALNVAYVFYQLSGLAASDCCFWNSLFDADMVKQDYERHATSFISTPAIFGTTVPLKDGIASAGSSSFYSRLDHVHPILTSGSFGTTTGGLPFLTASTGITLAYNSSGQWELTNSSGLPTATTANSIPLSDGPGSSYTAIDILAAMRAGIVIATPLTSSTGWTLSPGPGGSTSITPGHSLLMSTPNGSAASVNGASYVIPWPEGATGFAIQGRVQLTTTDTQGGIFARLFLSYTEPINIDQCYFFIEILSNGDCTFIVRSTGTPTFTVPLDGTLWWRMEFSGHTVRCYSGIGSGDVSPSSWIYRGSLSLTGWFNTTIGKGMPPKLILYSGYEGGGTTTDSIGVTHRMMTISLNL